MTAREVLIKSYIDSLEIYKKAELDIRATKSGDILVQRFNPTESWRPNFINSLAKHYYLEFLITDKVDGSQIIIRR